MLQRKTRPGGGTDTERAAEGRAQRRTDSGDLVLGLKCVHAERFALGQFVQEVGRGGDRVGAEEQRQAGKVGCADQAQRQGLVPRDLPVAAGRLPGGCDLVTHHEGLGVLAVIPAALQGGQVGVPDGGVVGEPLLEPLPGRPQVAAVEPADQAERQHVAGPGDHFAAQPELLHGVAGDAGEVEVHQLPLVERTVGQRIAGVVSVGQVATGVLGGVGDQYATEAQ